MKRKTAKEILADSFRELAERKSIDKIKVKDITENCGYSSATFYRQFRDKYDLIAWDYSRRASVIMDRVGVNGYAWRETLLDGAKNFEKEKAYLANLFLNTTGMDSFMRYMVEINEEHLRRCVTRAMDTDAPDEKTEMYIHVYCHGTVALTCEWVLGRFPVTAEELAEVFEHSLPQPLRPYLY